MYKNKALKRSYIFAYINVLFGLMIPVLLAYKVSGALSIVLLILLCTDLAALIVSHVYYSKDDKIYFWTGLGAIAFFDAFTLMGLIWESVYTAQGLYNHYAWDIIVLNLLSAVLLTLFFILDYFKKKKKAKESAENAKIVKSVERKEKALEKKEALEDAKANEANAVEAK